MLDHTKFVPDIFLQSLFYHAAADELQTNIVNSICNLRLTKLSRISKDGRVASGIFCHFYENENDKYNTKFVEIGFVWTSCCTRCVSNRR